MTQFPDRTADIAFHRNAVEQARSRADFGAMRSAFLKWVESIRQQNISSGGQQQGLLDQAKREYSEFVRTDPLYQGICAAAKLVIKEQPQIKQTELYKVLPQFSKGDIQYAMYFAADHGSIVRTKQGSTYRLALA